MKTVDNIPEKDLIGYGVWRKVTWSPYQLYQEFPKSRPAALRAKKELIRQVFLLQDKPRSPMRDRQVAKWIDYVFIDSQIEKLMARVEFLNKYINLCTYKKGDDRLAYAVRVARARAVPLSTYLGEPNHGGFVRCPFHEDRTPSMKVYKDNTFHCFSCDTGNDVIDLVRRMKSCGFLEALKMLGT